MKHKLELRSKLLLREVSGQEFEFGDKKFKAEPIHSFPPFRQGVQIIQPSIIGREKVEVRRRACSYLTDSGRKPGTRKKVQGKLQMKLITADGVFLENDRWIRNRFSPGHRLQV